MRSAVNGVGSIAEKTAKQYYKHTLRFANWCKDACGIKDFTKCGAYLQDYSNYMVQEGMSASTIHTYLAGPCHYFEVPLEEIKKPKRYCAENKRSRRTTKSDARKDTQREASPRLWDFASAVGVRRYEYQRLRCDDLVHDESGYLCVRIMRGKGGKFQLQRILPEDEAFVQGMFDGTGEYVFTEEEMKNKQDLHALRDKLARRAYAYYLERIKEEGRDKLIAEIKLRWKLYCDKPFNRSLIRMKPYRIRGRNKKKAEANGLPLEYDRLALLAVSVFHLSHWRLSVTVSNYMLAVEAP